MNKIFVTQPAMPPLDEFIEYLKCIWENKIVTNNGPFHQQFEMELAKYLGVKYISVFSNGTLALVTALQTLRITGEVITTPFSFVATTHSLWWNNIKPVFADIDPVYFNLDPEKIESAITPQTTAIMPVHVYGNPCKIEEIKRIADIHGLKVIYDAAHAFGVNINQQSILDYGDLSVLSFHATKAFNTIEGGAIVCHDEKTKQRIDFLKNFGFSDEVTVVAPGINAKMNEVQAAYGLLQLKYIDKYIARRKEIADLYRFKLRDTPGLWMQKDIDDVRHCYTYFPILIDEDKFGKTRDEVYSKLKDQNIYSRRYFYPLISQFPMYRGYPSSQPNNLPVASRISKQIICLPIFPNLMDQSVIQICDIIKSIN
jgi:dTDP-4-amino-4,6-dideoxygalactose transaminase